MTSNIIIGNEVATNRQVIVDVHELIKGRLLIQATSGGGKSYVIRKLLEETHGKIQHIILDMEGDFVTLREKFEYLLAGKGGQIPAEPRSAALLARKVLELNANIIIDLSELPQPDRKKFVRLFLENLIETPKQLWNRECLVVIDEAHIFCPEKGHGESEATEAINELMSRGRKRGLCGVLATQRPAKLNKDAASQCQNKLIGLASMDVDRKRSKEELGFTSKEQEMSLTKIKHQFYAVGPAISNEVILLKAGPVLTKHLEPGKVGQFKAVETEKAQSILAKLADLPQQAEQEFKDMTSLRAEVSRLRGELTRVQGHRHPTNAIMDEKEKQSLIQTGYDRAANEYTNKMNALRLKFKAKLATIKDNFAKIQQVANINVESLVGEIEELQDIPVYIPKPLPAALSKSMPTSIPSIPNMPNTSVPIDSNGKPLGAGPKKIVQFLALRPDRFFSKSQVGAMTGFAPASGTFGTYLSELKTAGYIEQSGQTYRLKALPPGVEVGQFTNPMQALTDWLNKMGNGGQKRIFEKILEDPTREWTKEELAAATEFEPGSGTYGTYLSNLATLTLIVKYNGKIKLNQELLAV